MSEASTNIISLLPCRFEFNAAVLCCELVLAVALSESRQTIICRRCFVSYLSFEANAAVSCCVLVLAVVILTSYLIFEANAAV